MSTPAIALPAISAASRGRLDARRLVAGQYVVVFALLTAWVVLEKFLGARSQLAFAVLGTPLLVASTLVIGAWAAWGISRQKVLVLLLAVVADVGLILGTSSLERAGDRLFFETRRTRLDAFARDIAAYGRIHQMSDARRHFTELNGQPISGSTRTLEQALARDTIDARRYEDFRQRLRDLTITQFDAQPGYVAFLYDGLLDGLEGYLLVKPGDSPPALRSTVFGETLIRLEPLGDGWYRFATT